MSRGGTAGGIIAGRDAGVFSTDYSLGSIDAGRYASLITSGDAAGPMTVKGPAGAYAWTYGDFTGFVESTTGDAPGASPHPGRIRWPVRQDADAHRLVDWHLLRGAGPAGAVRFYRRILEVLSVWRFDAILAVISAGYGRVYLSRC